MTHPFDLDSFVKDHQYPLQLVRQVSRIQHIENGLLIHCQTRRFQRGYRDRYGSLVEVASEDGIGKPVTIAVTFVSPSVMRFRMIIGEQDQVPTNHTPMLVDDYAPQPTALTVNETDEHVILRTDHLNVTIERNPWHMTIEDNAGKRLFDTIPAEVFQHPPTGMGGIHGTTITDAWPWFFRDIFPLGFVQDEVTGATQVFESNRMHYSEHLYGFGEKFSNLDKRGQMVNLWHENATGNTRTYSYKNVPFFMSSQGYGLYINSAYPIRYHLGDKSHTHYSLHLQHDLLDYFFVTGDNYKEILPQYTALTGKPALPPLWSFGLWMSRMSYDNQAQVEEVATRLRARDIPCDVIHIDTDWFASPWVNDLTFSQERFPDPAGMIAKLREQGFRLTLWQIPYIAKESMFYAEGLEHGYFAKNAEGTPYHIQGFFGQAAVIDYSNPNAVSWIQSKFEPLFDMGVAAIKTDFGEGAPPDAIYATVDGMEMHNLYPLLYNRAIHEVSYRKTGEHIVWARSAYAGCQRYPLNWGGDPAVLWGDLANLWSGGLGLGLCGFPFWSVDIGGFGGTPTPELYIRWAQAGLFVSHPRAHGPIAREPWVFGEEAEEIFRRYTHLRYRLVPYVWSTANHSIETSLPVMRPMILDWQSDPTTAHISDQFMFGEWLLVAPILDETDQRLIYLPEGQWTDYWTEETLIGPRWIERTASLEEMPLYVRGGAILPLMEVVSHMDEADWSHLTLAIYPYGHSSFTVFDPDRAAVTIQTSQTDNHLHIQLGNGRRRYTFQIHGMNRPSQILINQTSFLESEHTGWQLNDDGILFFQVDGLSDREVNIEVIGI